MIRATWTVTALAVLTQAAAFVRASLIAAIFGASLQVDAYNLGLLAPSFVNSVAATWLQVGFVGRYSSLLAKGELVTAAAYRTAMLLALIIATISVAVACDVLSNQIVSHLVPDGPTAPLTAAALKLLAWTIVPILITDFLSLVLNCHRRFFIPALSPFLSAVTSVVALWLWTRHQIDALIWSLLLGQVLQTFVVIGAAVYERLNFWTSIFSAPDEIKNSVKIGPALLVGTMLTNAAIAIPQLEAVKLGEGHVAIYGYALRLHTALSQILVIGVGTVLLPHLASLWANAQKNEISVLFRRLLRIWTLLSAYFIVGIFLMGNTATYALFGRGRFDHATSAQVASIWSVLSLSIFPLSIGTFISKFASALRSSTLILTSGAILFASSWLMARLGMRTEQLDIIALAPSVGATATFVFWLYWLGSKVELAPLLIDLGVSCLRALIVILPAAIFDVGIGAEITQTANLPLLFVRGMSFTLVALACLYLSQSVHWFFYQPHSLSSGHGY